MVFTGIIVLVFLLFISACVLCYILCEFVSFFTADVPFVPVPSSIEGMIVDSLKLTDSSVLYDLGCGDARILRKALEKYPNIQAVGVDIGFIPYLFARLSTRKNKQIQIRRQNIFETEVGNATHLFLYLSPRIMEKLMPILEKKCKKGTRIVSCDFQDKHRTPLEIIPIQSTVKGRGKSLIVYNL